MRLYDSKHDVEVEVPDDLGRKISGASIYTEIDDKPKTKTAKSIKAGE